jgi:membrane-associated phospholipid phosphatase
VWWALAWGCALTRVAAGAHFFSDVTVSFVGGWAVGNLVWWVFAKKGWIVSSAD